MNNPFSDTNLSSDISRSPSCLIYSDDLFVLLLSKPRWSTNGGGGDALDVRGRRSLSESGLRKVPISTSEIVTPEAQ